MKTIDKCAIIKLNSEGKTNSEIRCILGYSLTTISKYLKSENLTNNVTSLTTTLDKVKQLWKAGKTNTEIANILKISKTTVRKYTTCYIKQSTNSLKIKPISKTKLELNQEQLDLIFGSLLGDMSIDHSHNFYRVCINHGDKQEDYFNYKCNILKNILGKANKKPRYDKRTNKHYIKLSAKTLSHPIFNEFYNKLYINGVKTITTEWLDQLTPKALAFWFMDDGSHSGVLATNCFTMTEVALIKDWFKSKYNMILTIQLQKGQPVLYFTSSAKKIFYTLTNEFFIPSMKYKIQDWNP